MSEALQRSIYSLPRLNTVSVLEAIDVDANCGYYLKRALEPHWNSLKEAIHRELGDSCRITEEVNYGKSFKDLLATTKRVPTEEEKELALSMKREPVDSQTPHVTAAREWLASQSADRVLFDFSAKEEFKDYLDGLDFSSDQVVIACNWLTDRFSEREAADRSRRYEGIRTHLRQVMRDYRRGDLSYERARDEFSQSNDHYAVWQELGENMHAFSVVAPAADDAEVAEILAAMAATMTATR